jgi:hypothetical protein
LNKSKQFTTTKSFPLPGSRRGTLASAWATQEDAAAYESSGVYKSLVAKLSDFLAAPPVLKTYTAEEVLEMH